MSINPDYRDNAPVIEVRVFAADRLIVLEVCEDARQAADVVDRWSELPDISILVDDYTHVRMAPRTADPGPTVVQAEAPIAAAALGGAGWE